MSNQTPNSKITAILKTIRWGDFQREDGTWGYGVSNAEEAATQLQQLMIEKRIAELQTTLEPKKEGEA